MTVAEYTNSNAPASKCVSTSEFIVFGCTTAPPTSGGHLVEGVAVWMNMSSTQSAQQKRQTACHELGHAIGLGHRSVNQSCMTQGTSPPVSQYPDSPNDSTANSQHDTDALQNMYGHND